MTLKRLRSRIDRIDKDIVNMLNRRAEISTEIGRAKAKSGMSIYVPDREKEIYRHITDNNRGPLEVDSLKSIYREIMSGSLSLERPVKIAYLGPPYTFTHLAAMKKFGSSIEYKACDNITDIFTDVERDRADYGVVPIENSIEGAINHTLDMFIDSELKICSEVYLDIFHNLLSRAKRIKDIKRIYSKAEVFGQCRRWLEVSMPGVPLVEVSSTAKAAEISAKDGKSAAIGSIFAARQYGLIVIAEAIEDGAHNQTRFLVIGRAEPKPTKEDKTSIMYSLRDKVGALHDSLTPFKRFGINMTKIESRPSKRRRWEYYFFVDIEGHHHEPKVRKALAELGKEAAYLKILGSYPKSE